MTDAHTGPGPDRRRHDRVAKALPVHVHRERSPESFPGEIVNIGAGGVLLRTALPIGTNDLVSIDLDIDGEQDPIYVYGTVVRNDARGFGVSFVRISEVTADLISYLIRKWQRDGAPAA
ncbi:MAG TPA: PilZ domain-containing protein [Candidatus Eremiobacteraceae bacterium]|nr:PilZ domain-containing protein [Candidatus Eremiobacteraceae bacterium]